MSAPRNIHVKYLFYLNGIDLNTITFPFIYAKMRLQFNEPVLLWLQDMADEAVLTAEQVLAWQREAHVGLEMP